MKQMEIELNALTKLANYHRRRARQIRQTAQVEEKKADTLQFRINELRRKLRK